MPVPAYICRYSLETNKRPGMRATTTHCEAELDTIDFREPLFAELSPNARNPQSQGTYPVDEPQRFCYEDDAPFSTKAIKYFIQCWQPATNLVPTQSLHLWEPAEWEKSIEQMIRDSSESWL